ncbi:MULTISPECIES: M15 family metallopeptidase [Shewanella]|jgi:LAS superfamily LD-carboxypeptidase LdcB|uniref:LAS superfamily LD-carboxypeptidase LdcB n=1 Tax=Shewanella chilikensis TaxID=558541 RepID=A0ABX5PT93_9GAMM|nr:M15 family metallopeptidase [Shewanella chilikensis]MCE9853962.1 M15 family metallopeptidase [Shewanella chilikensis]MCL1154844.1 M15 family metallopeptidase [Shewanella chilikensis]MCL1163249.1 M15 family metallopeptidase [Shewanella chilikensis]PYE61089.1 LAS superfamily LD-carboxypeptidase LdcB [Shewanella chilikensis]GGZ31436.1 peptidase M15 [Shewanella chilikensis]
MAKSDFLYGLETEEAPRRTLVNLSGSESGSGAEVWLEAETAKAFLKMQAAAEQDGIALAICSGYRSFERQLAIWNAKASGKRPLLDKNSLPVGDVGALSDDELVALILLWSALPGASRHHWGTDMDLFDSGQISKHELKLVNAEYEPQGPCYKLNLWLDERALDFGFYRPFQPGLSGVSPERWHLSFLPKAKGFLEKFDSDRLRQILDHSDLALKQSLLRRLPELVETYVRRVAPYPESFT